MVGYPPHFVPRLFVTDSHSQDPTPGWPGNEARHALIYLTIFSGLWSLIGTALFLVGDAAECNLHAAFEGLCYCQLRLPQLVSHDLLSI